MAIEQNAVPRQGAAEPSALRQFRHALTAHQLATLMTVLRAPQPRTMSHLARELSVGKPRISRIIDRLVEFNLLSRMPNPADGRSVLVRPTRAGYAMFAETSTLAPKNVPEVRTPSPDRAKRVISARQQDLLDVLRQSSEPQTVRSLALKLNVGKASICRMIDRLVDAGLVQRVKDEKDARNVFIRLIEATPKILTPALPEPAYFNDYDLSPRQLVVLLTVTLEEGSHTISSLARELGITAAGVCHIVDRLTDQGLLYRMANPVDRRSVIVCATRAGQERLSDIDDRLMACAIAATGRRAAQPDGISPANGLGSTPPAFPTRLPD